MLGQPDCESQQVALGAGHHLEMLESERQLRAGRASIPS